MPRDKPGTKKIEKDRDNKYNHNLSFLNPGNFIHSSNSRC